MISTSGTTRSTTGPLVLISIWRLLLAGTALTGFTAALTDKFARPVRPFDLSYFSQLGALAVGLTALGGLLSPLWNRGRAEGTRGFVRGAATSWSIVVMVVFGTLLNGGYSSLGSKLEHLAVPILALLDWVFVGGNSTRLQWWWPMAWLAGPLLYLPLYVGASHRRGSPLYGFLDPDAGDFWPVAIGMLIGFAVVGYVVWGIGRLKRALMRLPATR